MGKTTQKLRRVMSRDGSICGLHWGGCGREIENRKDASLDHIIPQSYLEGMDSETKTEFRGAWNLQPMCRQCNEGKKGQVWGWPLFKCTCHWLQLTEDGEMYICETTGGKSNPQRHLFRKGAISEGNGVVFTANVGAGEYVDGNGKRWRGTSNGSGPFPVEMGHMTTCIPRIHLLAFNWFELARVGRTSRPLGISSPDGSSPDGSKHCMFLPNGQILGGRRYWFAEGFDLARGHENRYYNPFTPAKKVV